MVAHDALPPAEDELLAYVLERALEQEPRGVPQTECDAVVRGESRPLLDSLLQRGLLATAAGDAVFYVTLRAMLRRDIAFADSLAPLDGVLAFGRELLADTKKRDKVASVDDLVLSLAPRFPRLSSTPVQVRFKWALYGLEPFVKVSQAHHRRVPVTLQFLPALFNVVVLSDVLTAQEESNLDDEERAALLTFLRAFQATGRQAKAIALGEDVRRDVVLRRLISKGDAELLDTRRVVVTEKGLERAQSYFGPAVNVINLPGLSLPNETPVEAGPLERLLHGLADAGALTPDFAEGLGRDAREIEICLRHGSHKAVVLLCGSVLEAVLVDVLNRAPSLIERRLENARRKRRGPGGRQALDAASLADLLDLATASFVPGLAPLLPGPHQNLGDLLAEHRDLIHPRREARGGAFTIGESAASLMVGALRVVLEEVARAAEAGWIKSFEAAGAPPTGPAPGTGES